MYSVRTKLSTLTATTLVGLPFFLSACGATDTSDGNSAVGSSAMGGAAAGGSTTTTSVAGSSAAGNSMPGNSDSAPPAAPVTGSAGGGSAGSPTNTAGAGNSPENTGGAVNPPENTGGAANPPENTGGAANPLENVGGVAANGGSANAPPANPGGVIPMKCSFNDAVPGYASVDGGTTGGGSDMSKAVTVSSSGELKSAVSGDEPKIILIEPGKYGAFSPGSNKTIIGKAPGVTVAAPVRITGKENVILRNIAVRGEPCSSNEECRSGNDGVYIGNDAHHIWIDHVDIQDGQDGNLDITRGGDYVTVSWSKFWYSTSDKDHQFSNLIAGSDGETASRGKLKITYMNSWWADKVETRQPRGRFGNVHMLNNLHDSEDSRTLHGVGKEMALIAENSVYNTNDGNIWKDMGGPRGWKGIGNIGRPGGLTDSKGTVFTIPYKYTAMPATEVEAAVKAGAGNTCTF